ncbi:hypothetical protein GOP47_0014529 [Adiantum capillus-veneris]|uniref:Mediator of RNA polymerase II transcription subunit 27 n=1 Tax=Adiantum capillus-veneris TaxID=13818 RepID=A0A9D4UME9_ADICA|nr:hypothetical protein GOP47_0014529 [Adiantum capillus-veneris]
MQQPSPALSSPSTGFFGSRASPLFTQTVDQPDLSLGDVSSSALLHPVGSSTSDDGGQQAPPKQLAQAMEALSHAIRVIAEVRVGSDNILEALQRSSSLKSANSSSSSALASAFISRVADEVSASLDDLRATGKKLEALGVMNGAQQRFEEKHPWGLQVPLICSDGAIVAYSWKRQIAGQAAASAVERTRLALKAFTDKKRRFFQRYGGPGAEEGNIMGHADKRAKCWGGENDSSSQSSPLLDLLKLWQAAEGSGMIISAFSRLEWAKHKSASALQKRKLHTVYSPSDSGAKPGLDASSIENVAILEVTVPAVFKAVVLLFPSGSVTPDAVSLFSADEVCNNAHMGSSSTHAVFRRVSECATSALHFFTQAAASSRASPLYFLLYWLYTYRSLFSKPCSQCKRFLALDGPSDVLLPPLVRPAWQILRVPAAASALKLEDLNDEKLLAYHLLCIPKEESH